jgi:MoaA/NifB/PqqE/SkfB family radical SAM enzyme
MSEITDQQRELIASEKRSWVRLTNTCNNHCRFCHDNLVQDGTMRPEEKIKTQIRREFEDGAKRLILSGGEPTIHPKFVNFISFAKDLGYSWVQVVTNGRMFSYPGFTHKAVQAGLDEVTFSMHGQDARMHDHLVGVEGAFEQSMRGLANVQATAKIVVSVDIVITAVNISKLSQILDYYIDKGIKEFDLLWLVPFGRAWENRKELFCEQKSAFFYLQKALQQALKRGALIWTNRLPARMLEGLESLIQDPHKLHDEIRGRRPEFEDYLKNNQALKCKEPERCELCFIQDFCDQLEMLLVRTEKGVAKKSRLVLDKIPKKNPWPTKSKLRRVASSDPKTLDQLLVWSKERKRAEIEVILDKSSAKWLWDNSKDILANPKQFLISLRSFVTRSEAMEEGVNPPVALSSFRGSDVRLINMPDCMLPSAEVVIEDDQMDFELVNDDRSVNLDAFLEHYIKTGYRVFSNRCVECISYNNCLGMPINYIRRFGFEIIKPIKQVPVVTQQVEDDKGLCALEIDKEGTISVTLQTSCSNSCVFCSSKVVALAENRPLKIDSAEKIIKTMKDIRSRGKSRLKIIGIEPLSHPKIIPVLEEAHKIGIQGLEIWSHGGQLAKMDFARSLLRAGMTVLHVPVLGPDADSHDRMAGRKGAFLEATQGLDNLRELGFTRIITHMVVAKGNHTKIAETLYACEKNAFGPVAHIVLAEAPPDKAELFKDIIAPLYEMANELTASCRNVPKEFIPKVLKLVSRVIPPCLLIDQFDLKQLEGIVRDKYLGLESKQIVKCYKINRCDYAHICPGVHTSYQELFSDRSL